MGKGEKTTKYASTRFGIVQRSKGQSAIDQASYISRTEIKSEYDGKTYRPKYHEDLVHSEIYLAYGAPKEWEDRATLWNSIEMNEKQKNAQLARTMKAALPNWWSYELAESIVREYVHKNFVSKGMCADWAIHDSVNPQGQRNLHFHLMLTLRPIDRNGKWGAKQRKEYILDKRGNRIRNKSGRGYKSRAVNVNDWNNRDNAKKWRKNLVDTINSINEQLGIDEQWEHRSFKELGMEQQPTVHLGPIASALERQGIQTEKGDVNRAIIESNRRLAEAGRAYAEAVQLSQQAQEEQPPPETSKPAEHMQENVNEVAEMIDQILRTNGKLHTPLVGCSYFRKATDREVLMDAGSVKRFAERHQIDSFDALDAFTTHEDQELEKEEKQLSQKKEKRNRLQKLLEIYDIYSPYWEIRREAERRSGLKGTLYARSHSDDLEQEAAIRQRIEKLLEPGERITPGQWKTDARELERECEKLSASCGERQHNLAFVDVLRHNHEIHMLETREDAGNEKIGHFAYGPDGIDWDALEEKARIKVAEREAQKEKTEKGLQSNREPNARQIKRGKSR
ncbi:MAG: MobA/MobL family protein [Lachnospiraceae bacterium]|nr:MobA/MobL family protein [Lachnospiraceae bacterium]